jgi:hypothetical protein
VGQRDGADDDGHSSDRPEDGRMRTRPDQEVAYSFSNEALDKER